MTCLQYLHYLHYLRFLYGVLRLKTGSEALLLVCSLIWGDSGYLRWCLCGGTVVLHALGGRIARPRKSSPAHTAGKHHGHRCIGVCGALPHSPQGPFEKRALTPKTF